MQDTPDCCNAMHSILSTLQNLARVGCTCHACQSIDICIDTVLLPPATLYGPPWNQEIQLSHTQTNLDKMCYVYFYSSSKYVKLYTRSQAEHLQMQNMSKWSYPILTDLQTTWGTLATPLQLGQRGMGHGIVASGSNHRPHAICVQLDVVLCQNGCKLFILLLQHSPILDSWRGFLQAISILSRGRL